MLTDEANVTPHMNLQAALAYARNAQNGFAVLFQNDGDAFIKALHTELTRALVAYANTNAEQYTGILQLATSLIWPQCWMSPLFAAGV
ncbi:hypothetical protein [Lacticaseibacillus sharpeae]|uniref:hypothetical protein n=1 Tax=Lacticaseibacillus sharpeae TaxID=1626 RepID=UPI0006CFD72A|nr:hypothetical protein [Lacticaseibacillus sharpeae]